MQLRNVDRRILRPENGEIFGRETVRESSWLLPGQPVSYPSKKLS